MAEPARADPGRRGPRGRAGPPPPDRGGARPAHRPAGPGARPRRRRRLPRPRRRGPDRPRHGRDQRPARRRARPPASTATRCWPRPRRSRTTASGCPASSGRRRDRRPSALDDRPPRSGPASCRAVDVLEQPPGRHRGRRRSRSTPSTWSPPSGPGPRPRRSTPPWPPAATPARWPVCRWR